MSPLWKKAVLGVGLGALGFGCAHTTPQPLTDAQAAYERAQHGTTAQLSPQELRQAREALDRAERYQKEHPNDPNAQDLAYVALRRVEVAETLARARLARGQVVAAQSRLREEKSATEQQLAAERQRLEQEQAKGEQQAELEAQQQKVAELEQQLEAERQARASAEQSAQQSKEELEKVGKVREESRGLVLTLPGNLLFKSGSTKLAPSSASELKELASALEKLPDQKVTIEGHSDSRGPSETNQEISFARAQSVRLYLIDQGVDPKRLDVAGFGELRPIAANDSAEGRAMNRRVEIVLEKQPAQGVGGGGTQGQQPAEPGKEKGPGEGTGGLAPSSSPAQTQPAEPHGGRSTGSLRPRTQPAAQGSRRPGPASSSLRRRRRPSRRARPEPRRRVAPGEVREGRVLPDPWARSARARGPEGWRPSGPAPR